VCQPTTYDQQTALKSGAMLPIRVLHGVGTRQGTIRHLSRKLSKVPEAGNTKGVGDKGKPLARVGRKAPEPQWLAELPPGPKVCGCPGASQAFLLAVRPESESMLQGRQHVQQDAQKDER
jgi:hypothetical protein